MGCSCLIPKKINEEEIDGTNFDKKETKKEEEIIIEYEDILYHPEGSTNAEDNILKEKILNEDKKLKKFQKEIFESDIEEKKDSIISKNHSLFRKLFSEENKSFSLNDF